MLFLGLFGIETEKKIVAHVLELGNAGFSPDRTTIRAIAYQFAAELGLSHKFNKDTQLAGYDWLTSFLERNPCLSVRKCEGLSLARAQGMNREDVKKYFDILQQIMTENNLLASPKNIWNMDESGFPINNPLGKVLAQKGARVVQNITSAEKGEHVTIVGCCNAEGHFLPPVLILKGVYKKEEWSEGLPPGCDIYMNPKKAYMTTELFMKWFKEIFVPRKPPGKNLLILDGHSSHCSSPDLLQFAKDNDVIMFIFPSHTTNALQPLDRCIYGPFKTNLQRVTNQMLTVSKTKTISRFQLGKIVGTAWGKVASVENGISAFRATGIFPLNANAIPDYFFKISDSAESQAEATAQNFDQDTPRVESPEPDEPRILNSPGCSTAQDTVGTPKTSKNETPSKILKKLSPVPRITLKRAPRKQLATVLTSDEFIAEKKRKSDSKIQKGKKSSTVDFPKPKKKTMAVTSRNRPTTISASSTIDKEVDSNNCVECWENYFTTSRKDDWVRCTICSKWLHEKCSIYKEKCTDCGRSEIRNFNMNKQK